MKRKKKQQQHGVVVITVTTVVKNDTSETLWPMRVGFVCSDINDKAGLKEIAEQLVTVAKRNVWDNADYFSIKPEDKVRFRTSIKKMECDMVIGSKDEDNKTDKS